jgi:hypothetical protein
MAMNFKSSHILLLTCLTAVSCMTKYPYNISVLEPASNMLPADIKSAVVLNRTIIETGDEIATDGAFGPINYPLLNDATTRLVFSLADLMNESPLFEEIPDAAILEMSGPYMVTIPDPLLPELVVYLCDSLDANAIIALETFMPQYKIISNDIGNVSGTTTKGRLPQREAYLKVNSLWRVYSHDTGDVIDEFFLKDSLSFIYSSKSGFPPLDGEITRIAGTLAESCARRLTPTWVVTKRYYFNHLSNNSLFNASSFLQNGEIDEAEALYRELLSGSSENRVAAAAFNLALINEIRGDYKTAYGWAYWSYSYKKKSLTASYLDILKKRISDSDELDRQLGNLRSD